MKRRGISLIEVLVLLLFLMLIITFLLLLPIRRHKGWPAKRSVCASNLRQIYVSLYEYSNENNGSFPIVPRVTGNLRGDDAVTFNIKAGAEEDPFTDLDPKDPAHNNGTSQNLWILRRGDFTQAKVFLCPSSDQAGQTPNLVDAAGGNFVEGAKAFTAFPWEGWEQTPPIRRISSYSWIQPWTDFAGKHSSAEMWRVDTDPRVVLAADANNASNPAFRPAGGRMPTYGELETYVNSTHHNTDGQNVLFGDGHVQFKKTPYCGLAVDNIYTAMADDGAPYNSAANTVIKQHLNVRPRDQFNGKNNKDHWDTVLIPAAEKDLARWQRTP